jgi:hypothetical protein
MRISNQNIEMLLANENKKPLQLKTGQNVKAMILELQSENIAKIKIGSNIINAQISSNGQILTENQEMEFQVLDQERGIPVLKVVTESVEQSASEDLSKLPIGKEELNQLRSLMEKTGLRLSKSEIESIIKDDKSMKFLLKDVNHKAMDKGSLSIPKGDSDFQKNVTALVKDIIIKSQNSNSDRLPGKSIEVSKVENPEGKVFSEREVNKEVSDLKVSNKDILMDKNFSESKSNENIKAEFMKETENFKGLFKEVKNTLELVTFANKGKVEVSLGNLKALDSIFNKNGTLDKIFSSLEEKSENSELKELIKEIKNFTQIEKFAKIDSKKNYIEKLGSDIEKLLDLVEKEESSSKSSESRELKSVVEFFKSFNENKEDTYFYNIPFRNGDDDYTVDMFLKKDKSSKGSENDSFNILISLDTNSLGQVNSIIRMEKKNIAIYFKVENERIMDVLESSLKQLKDRLEDNVSITVGLQGDKGKFEEVLQFISNSTDSKFDLRI